MSRLFLLIIGSIMTCSLVAQRGLELGAWLGTTQYFGDLQTELTIADPGLAGGINARYNFDKRIAAKGSLSYGRISASDADSQNTFERQRNLSFFSDIWDLTGQIEFHFLPYHHGSRREYFTPYLLAGLSFVSFDPKTTLDGTTYALRYFGTEGQTLSTVTNPLGTTSAYGRFTVAPTMGVGFKWDINQTWSINIESSLHLTLTDYLDDVSSTYPDLDRLLQERGATALALSDRATAAGVGESFRQRGNSRTNDSYVFFGVSVMRYFGSIQCPDFSDR